MLPSPLTKDEERELLARVQDGDMEARARVIEANIRLVIGIARGYGKTLGQYFDITDLIGEGSLGLIHAVEKYNPKTDLKFSTYATYWIKHSIRYFLHGQSSKVWVSKLANRCSQIIQDYISEHHNHPEDSYVIKTAKTTKKKYNAVKMHWLSKCIANDDIFGEDGVALARCDDDRVEQTELLDKFRIFIDTLNERERTVICCSYGIDGYEKLNNREIGEAVGCTREYVRRIHDGLIETFREIAKSSI